MNESLSAVRTVNDYNNTLS